MYYFSTKAQYILTPRGESSTYCVKFLKKHNLEKSPIVSPKRELKIKYVFGGRKILNCRMKEKIPKMSILAHEVNQAINCTYVSYCTIFTILEATLTCYILNGMQSSETVEN